MITVPIPKRMRGLGRDKRGYPIPFVVMRDLDNKPAFTVNDTRKTRRCAQEKRCTICGNRLDSILWFVGGPQAAFHPNGAYLDSAMHHDCMTYALQVCPYLAAPKYAGRLDIATINMERVPEDMKLLIDHTMIPERPPVFVAVAVRTFSMVEATGGAYYLHPERPYLDLEFWKQGVRLSDEDGMIIVQKAFAPDQGEV